MRYTPYSFSKNWGIPLFYSFCAFIGEIVVYNDSASGIPRFDYFKIEVYTDAFLLLVVYLELTEVRYTTYLVICFWGIPQCWKVLRNQNLPKCTPDLWRLYLDFLQNPDRSRIPRLLVKLYYDFLQSLSVLSLEDSWYTSTFPCSICGILLPGFFYR